MESRNGKRPKLKYKGRLGKMQLEDELEDRSKTEVTDYQHEQYLQKKANTQHNSHTPNYTQPTFRSNLGFFKV
jgi:hypothetical protein